MLLSKVLDEFAIISCIIGQYEFGIILRKKKQNQVFRLWDRLVGMFSNKTVLVTF